jgi:hypothetical protein
VPDSATEPIPWSIETVAAFETVHDSVADDPDTIEVGDTENVVIVGGGGAVTVTVAVAVVEPFALVAVMV